MRRPTRVGIKVALPEELAGDIPFHCHLVDHEDNGMMAVLRVVPKKLGSFDLPTGTKFASNLLANPPICHAPAPAPGPLHASEAAL